MTCMLSTSGWLQEAALSHSQPATVGCCQAPISRANLCCPRQEEHCTITPAPTPDNHPSGIAKSFVSSPFGQTITTICNICNAASLEVWGVQSWAVSISFRWSARLRNIHLWKCFVNTMLGNLKHLQGKLASKGRGIIINVPLRMRLCNLPPVALLSP